jgi:hypothetical protein
MEEWKKGGMEDWMREEWKKAQRNTDTKKGGYRKSGIHPSFQYC